MKRAKSVDDYIDNLDRWQSELKSLAGVLRGTTLKEEIKWGAPCYTYEGKNIVGLGGYKSYFGLWFYQGALLNDDQKVLVNAQQGKTKALRQWRMTSRQDIQETAIRRYIKEAIKNVDAGREIKAVKGRPVAVPSQLSNALRRHKGATTAFRKLRIGQQREYAEYIESAQRDETKARRIAKILPLVVAGHGLHDKYRRK